MASIEEQFKQVREETARTDAGFGALERVRQTGETTEQREEREEEEKMVELFMTSGDVAGMKAFLAERKLAAERRGAEMADTDHLTGIFNRRALEREAGRIIEKLQRRHERTQSPEPERRFTEPGTSEGMTLVLVDLDHFKKLNDTHGHLAGDEALQAVARALKEHLRPSDIVARWGGEEFVVVLTSYNPAARLAVAEKIRKTVEAAQVEHGGSRIPVTASIGIAKWHPGESLQDMFQAADGALYHAKETGRNRIVDSEDLLAERQAAEDASKTMPPQ